MINTRVPRRRQFLPLPSRAAEAFDRCALTVRLLLHREGKKVGPRSGATGEPRARCEGDGRTRRNPMRGLLVKRHRRGRFEIDPAGVECRGASHCE